jgi:DNA modification methylase
MKTHHSIIIGDSRCMKELPDRSIHLIITSPPYWQLKDYGASDQIGFDDTYERYINNLNLVWSECHRVLYEGCRLCINIGDQFARSAYYGRYKVIPIRTEIIKFCEAIGLDYMGAIIWQKVTTCNTTGGATIMGSFPYPRSGILKLDYEFILIFRKPGKPPRVGREIKERSRLTTDEWNEYFSGHWHFSGEKQSKHIAMFPEELPRRLIRMFSFIGDTVLDPFLGSGTTSLAAGNLGRNSVGYEINADFLPIIEERLGTGEDTLFEDATFDVSRSPEPGIDVDKEIAKLPYVFRDAVALDKKVDPRKHTFGSRIDKASSEREEYHSVAGVISPEIMLLDDGTRIRLLGVRTISERKDEALEFLKEKTRGKKIFLRLDAIGHDPDRNLLCYAYLSNRTFLNAHLIKKGLAGVDTSLDYKHKRRFIKLQEQARQFLASSEGR